MIKLQFPFEMDSGPSSDKSENLVGFFGFGLFPRTQPKVEWKQSNQRPPEKLRGT